MARKTFQGSVHESIKEEYERYHMTVIEEVEAAVSGNDLVIVGMARNPFCRRARKAAEGANKTYKYLEYGSYFSEWKPRLAIKMWSGWPTFPQVFWKGELIGGAQDLERRIADGSLT